MSNSMVDAASKSKVNSEYNFELTIGRVYDNPKFVWNSDIYFKYSVTSEWMEKDIVKKIIKEVDRSNLCGDFVESEYLGNISWDRLSSGSKTLIILANDNSDNVFNLSLCGDNCMSLLSDIVKDKSIKCFIYHCPGAMPKDVFPIKITNDGSIVTSYEELIKKIIMLNRS